MELPKHTKALVLSTTSVTKQPVYHDVTLEERPIPALKAGEVLVRIGAAAFNHRDVWVRKGLYPGIAPGSVLGADGAGTVIASSDPNDPLVNERVFLTPMRGWEKDINGPESQFGILGGVKYPSLGTFAEYVVVERDQLVKTPEYLDDIHAAAWPLAGLTSWRAVSVLGQVRAGQNVLITGIGGGVALIAMQICLAKGATVYVTSGKQEKIDKAISLGAKGGAIYHEKNWPTNIGALLAKNSPDHKVLDVVIDSGGGDIMSQTGKILGYGGKVICYGMTANPTISFTMREVLKNQQLLGTMMGSHQDLIDATEFLEKHQIVPIVSRVIDGLEYAEEGFEWMKQGSQFGKIVIRVSAVAQTRL